MVPWSIYYHTLTSTAFFKDFRMDNLLLVICWNEVIRTFEFASENTLLKDPLWCHQILIFLEPILSLQLIPWFPFLQQVKR